IGIGILAVVFVLVIAYWQFIYCENKFHTLANEELKNYKYCASDSDCKVVGCGQCVNLEGVSKYNNLKSYCFREPHWKCLIPERCSCVNNACKEISQEQRAVEIATAHLSFPVTIIEVKKLECQGCFSVQLLQLQGDKQRQFTIVLDNWEIKNVVQSDNVNVLPAPLVESIAKEHLQKYVHNAFPNVDFFSMVKKVEVVEDECEANHYWKNWGKEPIKSPSKHSCWIVKFYYPGHAEGSHLVVYVDKNTNEVIGGTQTK
ncbi:hypothetical protein KKB69_02850, partial [Patescibacteria group bacterium]|nr:hypothetical protein [Patescibacteria group bacterium]